MIKDWLIVSAGGINKNVIIVVLFDRGRVNVENFLCTTLLMAYTIIILSTVTV